MSRIFIVLKDGCVYYVSGEDRNLEVEVLDLDDIADAEDPEDIADNKTKLAVAASLPHLWRR